MLSCDKELKNCNSSVIGMTVERVSSKEFQSLHCYRKYVYVIYKIIDNN